MSPKDKEALSALLDGEASELETRRILAQSHDPELQEYWELLCRQRDLSHEESRQWVDQDLRQGIWAELDGPASSSEPAQSLLEDKPDSPSPRQASVPWWASLAVAASVMAIVVMGVGPALDAPGAVAPGAATPGSDTSVVAAPANPETNPLAVESGLRDGSLPRSEPVLVTDAERLAYEERLQAFLLEHAGEGGMVASPAGPASLARLTSYAPSAKPAEAVKAEGSDGKGASGIQPEEEH